MATNPIVITDESVVNTQGFRVMTDGGDLSTYFRNPILLYDHARRQDDSKEVILPIGKMVDIQRKGGQYIARPEFDLDDNFAAEIARKYNLGILNMASIGFMAVEWTEDPSLMLPGQTQPTVTKWKLMEVSITDIGSNPNCHKVYNEEKVLTLSAHTSAEEIKTFFNKTTNSNFKNRSKGELTALFDQLCKGEGLNKLRTSSDPKDAEFLTALWLAKYGKQPVPQVPDSRKPVHDQLKFQLTEEFDRLVHGDGLNRLRDSKNPADREHLNLLWLAKFDRPFFGA